MKSESKLIKDKQIAALLSVRLYGFMTGVRPSPKLEAACRDQVSYLWITGWYYPGHNTLWRFYQVHRQAMRKLIATAKEVELRCHRTSHAA